MWIYDTILTVAHYPFSLYAWTIMFGLCFVFNHVFLFRNEFKEKLIHKTYQESVSGN